VGTADEALGDAGAIEHFLAEPDAGADADAFSPDTGNAAGEIGMDLIDGLVKVMNRVFGGGPAVVHIKGSDEGQRFGGVFEQADSFHVGLSAEDPDVADEDIVGLELVERFSVGVDNAKADLVRSADGNSGQKGFERTGFDPADIFPVEAGKRFFIFGHPDLKGSGESAFAEDGGFADVFAIALKDLMIQKAAEDFHELLLKNKKSVRGKFYPGFSSTQEKRLLGKGGHFSLKPAEFFRE
jgi:hypothetical protein